MVRPEAKNSHSKTSPQTIGDEERLSVNRVHCTQLDHEIKQVEQQMRMKRREVTPDAVARMYSVSARYSP